MRRKLLLASSILLFFLAGLLAVPGVAVQAINDAEWGHVQETGLPSHPEKLTWSEWRHNDGSVQAWYSFRSEQAPTLTEYRVGHEGGLLFDFTAYQGRFQTNGTVQEYPALGPNWGVTYHGIWAELALALAGGCLLARHFAKK